MMKARILGLMIVFFLPLVIHAENLLPYIPQIEQNIILTQTVNEISSFSIQPTEEEFPLWAKDLRRAEIITFGSFPFTLFFSMIAVDTYQWGTHDWDNRYAPWPIRGAGAVEMSMDQRVLTLGIALGVSVLIATADHIIIRMKRSNEAKKAAALPSGEPIIIRRPIDDFPEDDENEESSDEVPSGEVSSDKGISEE
jgi:hypothetical protein